jgi:hypothetical protein
MGEYQYYEDFRLGNKTLSSFNGVIINTTDNTKKMNLLPEIEHVTDKDTINNGERYIRSRYQPRIIEISTMFNDDVDIEELNAWLGNNKQQTFSWEDEKFIDKEIDVIYNKGFDAEVYYGKDFHGEVDLTFIAHDPLWRIKNEKEKIITNPVIGTEYYIKSKGNIDSNPIIRIIPNGLQSSIVFSWNDLIITLQNVDKEIYIDSSGLTGQVYNYNNGIKISQMTKFYSNIKYDFPVVVPFIKNKLILTSGSVSQIGVKVNSRIL